MNITITRRREFCIQSEDWDEFVRGESIVIKFRDLKSDEVEVRVGATGKNGEWLTLLFV